jgi:hypothetical protein
VRKSEWQFFFTHGFELHRGGTGAPFRQRIYPKSFKQLMSVIPSVLMIVNQLPGFSSFWRSLRFFAREFWVVAGQLGRSRRQQQ